ncbi:MAG: flagellar hook-basal body complex protein [Campylobacterota bacterium]|nr:flagellar hook-basal body complex protein [Campylobacterota bacterium]
MIGALYNGTSGLYVNQDALDVDSHNISNVNTTGYKSDRVSFADMMYSTKDIGTGAFTNSVDKMFNQGSIKQTGNDYDFTLQGEGFFTLSDPMFPTKEYYSRAGEMHKDENGFLASSNDMHLLGVTSVASGDTITSDHKNLLGSVTYDDGTSIVSINSFSKDYYPGAQTGSSGDNLKTASLNLQDVEALKSAYQNALNNLTDPSVPAFKQQDTISIGAGAFTDGRLSIEINGMAYLQDFDTNIETTLTKLSDNISKAKGIESSVVTDPVTGDFTLSINSLISGRTESIGDLTLEGAIFSTPTNVTMASGSGQELADAIYTDLNTKIDEIRTAMGIAVPIAPDQNVVTNTTTLTKATSNSSVASSSIQLDLNALGLSENGFGDMTVENGNIYLTQGGAKFIIAQVAPVNFTNKQGLNPVGDNLYEKTTESGDPVYIENQTKVSNKGLEQSTADLSKELVNLMVHQKAYEANSKSITTADEFLKTAIELKK